MSAFPDTPVSLLARFAHQVTGECESAWTRFFEMYRAPIMKFAEYAGAKGETEDVSQEVFLKLVEVLRQGRYVPERGKFRSYLATLIHNEVINRWQKEMVRGAGQKVAIDDDDSPVEVAVPSETAAIIDAKWRLALRESAIEHVLTKTALSQQSKEVYRAYVIEGRPIEEVSATFGLSRNSVSQIKTRVERMISKYEAAYLE